MKLESRSTKLIKRNYTYSQHLSNLLKKLLMKLKLKTYFYGLKEDYLKNPTVQVRKYFLDECSKSFNLLMSLKQQKKS